MLNNLINVLDNDPYLRQQKEKAFKRDMQYFTDRLQHIYNVMPFPGMVVKDGIAEPLPILPSWQRLIDYIEQERSDFIKRNYPEINFASDRTADVIATNFINYIFKQHE